MLYEQLTNKSFFQCETEEEILWLMYASFIINNKINITFNAFVELLDDKALVRNFFHEFEGMSKFMGQMKKEEGEGEGMSKENNMRMTDVIMSLITKVDIHYVLYEMEMWELVPFMENIENSYKADMEEKRMWAYINVMPHIDHKKCKSPEQLLPFPWTKEDKKKRAEEGLKNNEYAIKHTIGMTFIPNKKDGE